MNRTESNATQPTAGPETRRALRLAVVEDDPDYRSDLVRLIESEPDWKCCAACASASEALRDLPIADPDLILIDIQLPDRPGKADLSGLDLVPRLHSRLPRAMLVMLTVMSDTDGILRAVQEGACGYILKGDSVEDLLGEIRNVVAGGAMMSPAIARKLIEWFRGHKPSEPGAGFGLTEREWEILSLTARGHSQNQIAQELGISRNTVRNHFQNIYAKFQVNSSAAVIYQVAPVLKIREALRAAGGKPPGCG